MKASMLKKMIKEAVKEAIQEELKEVLLEAVRSPKQVINESKLEIPSTRASSPLDYSKLNPSPTPSTSLLEKKQKYMDVLGETALNFTSKDVPQRFNPQGSSIDTTSPNGQLPGGELGMDQIMNLMTGS